MNDDSYRWQIAQDILNALSQEGVQFLPAVNDNVRPILRDSITVWKVVDPQLPRNQGYTMTPVFPGILVTSPLMETIDPSAGENAHDSYQYEWLIQIVDSDNLEPVAGLRTYWKWQEQIVRLLNFRCPAAIDATHVLYRARSVSVVDRKKWVVNENFVSGVYLRTEVWLTRGAT